MPKQPQWTQEYLRGRVHEILEGREDLEKPVRYKLKVAMSHVVHEIDIYDIRQKT